MDTNTINHVSLCSGYGGIDLGLKRAIGERLRTVAFVEVECFAVCNLAAKAEAKLLDNAPIWSDLRTFPWGKFHGLVDILSGGYPCQPFSAAGKRLGAEDPRHLWPHISAGIALMRPSVCFFENVEGHISLGLPDVIEDLAGMGYRTTWCVFSASEVGAPHQRKRIFILAYDTSLGIQGRWPSWIEESRPHAGQALPLRGGDSGCGDLWPSRPGQQQYEWEPPRVVGNAEAAGRRQDIGSVAAPRQGEQEERQQWRPASSNFVDPDSAMDDAASVRSAEPAHGRGQAAPWADASGDEDLGNATRLCASRSRSESSESTNQWWRRLGDADCKGAEQHDSETQPSLGRDADGLTHRLDDAVLHVTTDNRTDELRLLGNGVVPATAERAFRVLVGELREEQR